MYFEIIKAEYISDYKLKLDFEDGKKGIVNLENYVNDKNIFSKFNDIEYFKNFYIDDGILTWGEGEIDIAPETLYLKATGEKSINWDNEELNKAS